MGRLPEEVFEKIKAISIVDYAMANGYELVEIGNQVKVRNQGGLFIDPDLNRWNCLSDDSKEAGGGIIQFVMYTEKKSMGEAIHELAAFINHHPEPSEVAKTYIKKAREYKKTNDGIFKSPEKSANYRRIFAYLIKTRCIDPEVVNYYVKHHKIYEDKNHNCAFCGFDENGVVKSISLRGTYDVPGKEPFKGIVENSDKHYPFIHEGKGNQVLVFEAPIDMLSFQTLKRQIGDVTQNKDDHYIALNGVAHIGLLHYLETHPEIENVVMCLDNDEPGHKNTLELINAVEEESPGKYNFDLKIPPEPHKDWNQLLQHISKEREKAALQEVAEDEWAQEA
ncbi:DUF3991 domain-containing protein [Acetobacterium malicum]|jgi:hypothetical protein|uniref:DUF3991 domain-containing protein n=1 Tax=Acetobacterium malicum TaxID=52692 RepID=A0ABR6YWY4_9FIRM|nr:DUF3991 and TOPRIM domain-containing protein [Acetobacterium malicum]MBC3899726.1 DUF3991 domain-containing protein [Acetobacterium malicum]